MATRRFPFVVKRLEHLVRPESNPRFRIARTPTLLSLDGGGMRGVITAQVLGQLEDSIKQVLWKERLITTEAADALLSDAVQRVVITPKQKEELLNDYAVKAPSIINLEAHARAPSSSEADYKALWEDYRTHQLRLLSPPAQWPTLKQCFEIDIADFFDQLAGTSTGGLLALYLASKGGRPKDAATLKSRPGSAAGASDFYVENGARIFDTDEGRKQQRFLDSNGKMQHDGAGLEAVLEEIFGDLTLDDLEEYGTNVLITTVDVSMARSGSFFHMTSKPPPAYTGPNISGRGASGLATPLRKSDRNKSLLVRDPRRPGAPAYEGQAAIDAAAEARERRAIGWLSPMVNYGQKPVPAEEATATQGTLGTNRNDIKFITTIGGWVAPTHFENYNFKLVDVGRATSAAPAFLPPKVVRPVGKDGKYIQDGDLTDGWSHRVFVDGGLANNDPVYMGLGQMLQRNNSASLQDCAILSIGTGTKAAFDGYDLVKSTPPPSNPSWLDSIKSSVWGAAKWISLGKLKIVEDIPKTILHVGGLVGLTMDLNGEDKENILSVTLYGLLRVPTGTYLRIQLKDEPTEYRTTRSIAKKVLPSGSLEEELELQELPEKTRKKWRDALGKMDDPRPETIESYKEMGEELGRRYALRLTWWARSFIFGLEEAAKTPFVLGLDDLDDAKEVQGGRFLASSVSTGDGKL